MIIYYYVFLLASSLLIISRSFAISIGGTLLCNISWQLEHTNAMSWSLVSDDFALAPIGLR